MKTKLLFVCLLLNSVYLIAQSAVTSEEYAEFLNKNASSDDLHLYDEKMAGDSGSACIDSLAPARLAPLGLPEGNLSSRFPAGCILRFGTSGNYSYEAMSKNNSAGYVDALSAMRYANWKSASQQTAGALTPSFLEDSSGSVDALLKSNQRHFTVLNDTRVQQASTPSVVEIGLEGEIEEVIGLGAVVGGGAEMGRRISETDERREEIHESGNEARLFESPEKNSEESPFYRLENDGWKKFFPDGASIPANPSRDLKVNGRHKNWIVAIHPKTKDSFKKYFFPPSKLLDPSKYNLQICSLEENQAALTMHLIGARALLQHGKNYQDRFLKKFDMAAYTRRGLKEANYSVFLSTLTGAQRNVGHFEALAELIFKHAGKMEELYGMQVPNLPPARARLLSNALESSKSAIENALLFGTRLAGEKVAEWNPRLALPARGRAEACGGRSEMLVAVLSPTITAGDKKVREDQAVIYTKEREVWNKYELEQDDQQKTVLKSQAEAYRKQVAALSASLTTTDQQKKTAHQNEAKAWGLAAEATAADKRICYQGQAEAHGKEAMAWNATLKATSNEEKNARSNQAEAYRKQVAALSDLLTTTDQRRKTTSQNEVAAYQNAARAWGLAAGATAADTRFCYQAQAEAYEKEATAWVTTLRAASNEEREMRQSQAEDCGKEAFAWGASLTAATDEERQLRRKEAEAWAAARKTANAEEKTLCQYHAEFYGANAAEWATYSMTTSNNIEGELQERLRVAYQDLTRAWDDFINGTANKIFHQKKIEVFKKEIAAWNAVLKDNVGASQASEIRHNRATEAQLYRKAASAWDASFQATKNEGKEIHKHRAGAYENKAEIFLMAGKNYNSYANKKNFYDSQLHIYGKELTTWDTALKTANVDVREIHKNEARAYKNQAEALDNFSKTTDYKKRDFYQGQANAFGDQAAVWGRASLAWDAFLKVTNSEEKNARNNQALAYKNQAVSLDHFSKTTDYKKRDFYQGQANAYGDQAAVWNNAALAWDAFFKATHDEEREVLQRRAAAYEQQAIFLGIAVQTTDYSDVSYYHKINEARNAAEARGKEAAFWNAYLKATSNEEKKVCRNQAEACGKEAMAWDAFGKTTIAEKKALYKNQVEACQKKVEVYKKLLEAWNNQAEAYQGKIKKWDMRAWTHEVSPVAEEVKTTYDNQIAAYKKAIAAWDQSEGVTTDRERAVFQNQAKAYQNQGAAYSDQASRILQDTQDADSKVAQIKKRIQKIGIELLCNEAAAYGREALVWNLALTTATPDERLARENQASSYRKQAEGYEILREQRGSGYWYIHRSYDLNSMEVKSATAYEQQINLYGEQAQIYGRQAMVLSTATTATGEKKEGLLNQATALGKQAETYNMLDWDFDGHRNDRTLFQVSSRDNYIRYLPISRWRVVCQTRADAYASEAAAWGDYAKATTQEERAKHRALAMQYQRQARNADSASSCVIN